MKKLFLSLVLCLFFVTNTFALTIGEAHDYLFHTCCITASDSMELPHTFEGKVVRVYITEINNKMFAFMAVKQRNGQYIDICIDDIIRISVTKY